MKISAQRLSQRINTLSQFNDTPKLGVSRFSYTKADKAVRQYLQEQIAQMGLTMTTDPVGNIKVTYEGTDPTLPPLWIGSHIDSVKNGGRYDGIVGSIGGLEVLSVFHEMGYHPTRSVELVIFAEEEGSNFGTTMVGSKCMVGKLNVEGLKTLKDQEGNTAYARMEAFGLHPENVDQCVINKDTAYGMIELHIEQGIVLDESHNRLGVVQCIAGMTSLEITVEGQSNHAGATPMQMRHDPLVAASLLIAKIETFAKKTGETTVATVGRVETLPGMANVIPKTVKFTVDIRDVREEGIATVVQKIRTAMMEISKERGVDFTEVVVGTSNVYPLSPKFISLVEEQVKSTGEPYLMMNSGAVHDCAMFTPYMDVAMIFVPSIKGNSHNPYEDTKMEDIALGVQVYLDTVIEATK